MSSEYDPDLVSMGNRIAERREKLGISAKDFAIRVDITAQALSAIENGHSAPKLKTLMRICKELGCSMADIQPEELDRYDTIPNDFYNIARILQTKPLKEQKMMLRMFEAQLATI